MLNPFPKQLLDRARQRLSRHDALLLLSIMGLITGLFSGIIIELFRFLIDNPQKIFLPSGVVDDFESLQAWQRFILPIIGSGLIAGIFYLFGKKQFTLGVLYVMERLSYHQGHLSTRSLLLQLFAGAIALFTGHSVGREGPSVHLGAATGSILSRQLQLPNHTTRTMVGCGSAAAIAASFNTPLAGVIFALEVIMQEYTLASFAPVILSAVSATAISYAVHGGDPAFTLPAVQLTSLWELPFILLMGIVIGSLSAGFIFMSGQIAKRSYKLSFYWRIMLAGVLLGGIALFVPQVMGMGYDTVEASIMGQLGISVLLLIIVGKLIASSISTGLGSPAGLIGPTLVMGAALGALFAEIGNQLFSESSNMSLYVLLGMGAMMGATLQAPLAALTAVMELTATPSMVLPGMLVIIAAGLISSEGFRQPSIFRTLLQARGLDFRYDPVLAKLRQRGIMSMANERFERCTQTPSKSELMSLLDSSPRWLIVSIDGTPSFIISANVIEPYLESLSEDDTLDLLSIPAERFSLCRVDLQASLQDAIDALRDSGQDAIYIARPYAPGIDRIYGVVTRNELESTYRY